MMQWFDVVLDPLVQSRLLPVPLLATSVLPGPMSRKEVAPAGVEPGGTPLALPPPMYRHEVPRSSISVVQPVSEWIAPENGADAGVEKPAPPQLVVPAVVVNERLFAGGGPEHGLDSG